MKPVCGTAVFWPNTSRDASRYLSSILHAGVPITKKGVVKYGMNVWITLPEDKGDNDQIEEPLKESKYRAPSSVSKSAK